MKNTNHSLTKMTIMTGIHILNFKIMIGLAVLLLCTGIMGEKTPKFTSDKFMQQGLAKVNELRALHGSPPVALNKSLSADAEDFACRAAKLAQQKGKPNAYYSRTPRVGEISWISNSSDEVAVTTPIQSWYDKGKKHNFGKNEYSFVTAEFTEMIWRGAKQFGIAICSSPLKTYQSVIARFLPKGNWAYKTSFAKNVFPSSKDAAAKPKTEDS